MIMEGALAMFVVFGLIACVDVLPAANKDVPQVLSVTQVIPGSEKPICYDISGNSGDIFSILDEPSTGLKINAKLMSGAYMQTSLPRVRELGIFTDDLEMYLESDQIRMNGHSIEWSARVASVGGEANGKIQINDDGAMMEIGRTRLRVFRNPLFMDVIITIDGPLSKSGKGIIGDISSRARLAENGKGVASLSVRGVDDSTSTVELSSLPHCWEVPRGENHKDNDFHQISYRNRIDCIECIRTRC